jgi:hypothetical protein
MKKKKKGAGGGWGNGKEQYLKPNKITLTGWVDKAP